MQSPNHKPSSLVQQQDFWADILSKGRSYSPPPLSLILGTELFSSSTSQSPMRRQPGGANTPKSPSSSRSRPTRLPPLPQRQIAPIAAHAASMRDLLQSTSAHSTAAAAAPYTSQISENGTVNATAPFSTEWGKREQSSVKSPRQTPSSELINGEQRAIRRSSRQDSASSGSTLSQATPERTLSIDNEGALTLSARLLLSASSAGLEDEKDAARSSGTLRGHRRGRGRGKAAESSASSGASEASASAKASAKKTISFNFMSHGSNSAGDRGERSVSASSSEHTMTASSTVRTLTKSVQPARAAAASSFQTALTRAHGSRMGPIAGQAALHDQQEGSRSVADADAQLREKAELAGRVRAALDLALSRAAHQPQKQKQKLADAKEAAADRTEHEARMQTVAHPAPSSKLSTKTVPRVSTTNEAAAPKRDTAQTLRENQRKAVCQISSFLVIRILN